MRTDDDAIYVFVFKKVIVRVKRYAGLEVCLVCESTKSNHAEKSTVIMVIPVESGNKMSKIGWLMDVL